MLRKLPSAVPQIPTSWCGWAAIASIALGISACAVSSVQPLTVPLVYKSASKPTLTDSLPCSTIARVQASDARTDKTLGTRSLESKPLTADVSVSGDAGSWVEDGVQKSLTQAGMHVQGNGPALAISLDSLRTSESIWHRASYDARIALSTRLQSPTGKVCWQDKFEGTSGDYGYAGNIETYQGTLNGALDAAAQRLVQSQGFRTALCHCGN